MRASDVALDEGLELARRLHLDDPSTSLPPLSATIVGMCCTAYFATTCGFCSESQEAKTARSALTAASCVKKGWARRQSGHQLAPMARITGLSAAITDFDVGVVDHHDVVHENFSFKRTGAFGAAGFACSGMPSFDLLDTSYHVPSSNCKCFLLA